MLILMKCQVEKVMYTVETKVEKNPKWNSNMLGRLSGCFIDPHTYTYEKKSREKRGKREKHVVVADGRCCTMPYYIY